MAITINRNTKEKEMTRTLMLALAVLSLAGVASAQQMDGKNCEWAYKKHQQHRVYGVCNEKSGEEKGGSSTPERAARHASGLKD